VNHEDVLERLSARAPQHGHLWRFLAGAIYAIRRYEALPLRSQSAGDDAFYAEELARLVAAFRGGVEPPSSWLWGFYYNAAVMRLDAVWDRSLRIMVGTHADGPSLYRLLRKAKPAIPAYEASSFSQLRREVNKLKHQPEGAPEAIRHRPKVVTDALEELVTLLEGAL
jgi:hypothetical protein